MKRALKVFGSSLTGNSVLWDKVSGVKVFHRMAGTQKAINSLSDFSDEKKLHQFIEGAIYVVDPMRLTLLEAVVLI